MLEDIRKCPQTLNKSGVEQAALFRAWGEKNNLNMEKYRQEVKKELTAESQKPKKGGCNFFGYLLFIFISSFFC